MKNSKIWLGVTLLSAVPLSVTSALAAPLTPTLFSKSEGFSVWLPGKAQVGSRTQQIPGAGSVQAKYYAVPSPSISFVIVPMKLPGVLPKEKAYQFLDGVQRGFSGAPGAKLLSSKSLNLAGMPGRELVVTVGATRIQGRFFVTSKRSYQVLAIAPMKSAAPKAPLIAKVLNSFRILK